MNDCIKRGPHMMPFMLCTSIAITLIGCAGSPSVREQERAKYEALENEMIDTQAAEERRRQSELRIAEKLQQMDAERARATQQRLSAAATAAQAAAPASNANTTQNLDSIWKLENFPSPIDGKAICAVVSEPVVVLNGSLDTRVRVIVGKNAVFLRTDATFDTETPESGFRLDAGFPIAFDRFHNELTAVIDASYERFISALETGSTLSASFAYSPQLSPAETYIVEFTLESLTTALQDLADCTTLESDADVLPVPAES